MKNYQGVNYRKYYAQDENGNYVEVDRKSCFARGETPSTANPLKQRWFYDEEAGYVVRLSRTIESEDIHRFISSDLKKTNATVMKGLNASGKRKKQLNATKIALNAREQTRAAL